MVDRKKTKGANRINIEKGVRSVSLLWRLIIRKKIEVLMEKSRETKRESILWILRGWNGSKC